ncbi:MAG: aminotransferase class III-fold pyridoxal phosphate-dependent enzyme [Fimbriimonadia bacterium]|jgi:acetylornithine/succinyldiaminopimelate/putrescine aminotransferase
MSALVDTYETLPFTVIHGDGMYVYDTDGREYLDLYGGHAVALLGHSPPSVAQAIAEQAKSLLFYSNVAPLDVRDRAARMLTGFAGAPYDKVFFCNSGAEANENALRLAVEKLGRSKIAALRGAFHGRTLLAAAATDQAKRAESLNPWSGPVLRLVPNCTEEIRQIDTDTAAVIVEPILSMAGVITLDHTYLEALVVRCREVGAWLIFDEVQTGMGRTGVPFVAGSRGVFPQMVTLAKGIAAGVPMGALLMTGEVAEQVKMGDMGSTFGGGPLACAAMCATVETLEAQDLATNAARIESWVKRHCHVKGVEAVLGRGALLGLRLSLPAKEVHDALMERGIITGKSRDPHVLRLLPPLITREQHVIALAKALGEVLHA